MFKIVIGAIIVIAIFFKFIVPIWMDMEDTAYEIGRKKKGKASAAEIAKRGQNYLCFSI
jgi:hypothetical protein